jgi:hypothetical protein
VFVHVRLALRARAYRLLFGEIRHLTVFATRILTEVELELVVLDLVVERKLQDRRERPAHLAAEA